MKANTKPRVIQDYEKLSKEIKEQIKLYYPDGYSDHLITFKNAQDETVSALPFETDEKVYMVRMSVRKAQQLVDEDNDYDEDGVLLSRQREKYMDKYADLDYLFDDEDMADDNDIDEDDYYND